MKGRGKTKPRLRFMVVLVVATIGGSLVPSSTRASSEARRFRLGLTVGAPVALAAAVDLGAHLSLHSSLSPPSDHTALGLRIDVVRRWPELGGEVAGVALVGFWFGPGLRWTIEDEVRSYVGARVPFGVSVYVPGGGELFAEIAPALVLHPERRALVEAGLGLRLGLF